MADAGGNKWTGKHDGYGRRRGLPVDDALHWRPANLLPVTKFIARALFTKCLGQVDLVTAPRNTVHRQSPPPPVSAMLPHGVGLWNRKIECDISQGNGLWENKIGSEWERVCVTKKMW